MPEINITVGVRLRFPPFHVRVIVYFNDIRPPALALVNVHRPLSVHAYHDMTGHYYALHCSTCDVSPTVWRAFDNDIVFTTFSFVNVTGTVLPRV